VARGGPAGTDDLARDLSKLRDDVARLSESVAQMLREQTDAATVKLRGAAGDALDTMSEAANSISRAGTGIASDTNARLETLGTELQQSIHKSPLTALMLAAGFGMLFGMMRR